MLQKIQENYGNILGTYYLCEYGTQKNRKNRKKNMYAPGTLFSSFFQRFLLSHFYIIFYEDEDRKNIKIG